MCEGAGSSVSSCTFGFKLHLVVSGTGELLNMSLTPGNVNDKKPAFALLRNLFGKVFGDKGYISRLLEETLSGEGVELITKTRKGMKPRDLPPLDKLLLRKRAVVAEAGCH